MNYYEALKRESDERWDFTRNARPVGYCRAYEEIDPTCGLNESELRKHTENSHKHHTCGHATEEDARACYKEYILDHKLRLNKKDINSQHKCKICKEWTSLYAEVDTNLYILCELHNNRESVDSLMKNPGFICSSW